MPKHSGRQQGILTFSLDNQCGVSQHVVMRHVAIGVMIVAMSFPPGIRAQFEAASIKPGRNCAGGRGGGGGAPAPGRVNVKCFTLQDYIQSAYGMFADGLSQNPHRMQIFGGPDWSTTETWDIDARAESNAPVARMYGPLLQRLLEERFHLKIHKEQRELPIYTLTVAKNGLKLQPTREGSCAVLDLNRPPGPDSPMVRRCGSTSVNGNTARTIVQFTGQTISSLIARSFYADLDRPFIDKTGLTGMFDIHLEFARDGAPADDTSAPSIFTAIQDQLGLKLTPNRGPVEVLVIDHVERPGEN